MIASYRDPRYAASIRLELLQEREGELREHIPNELRVIHARRAARTAGGAVAILGFAALVIVTLVWGFLPRHRVDGAPTLTLLFTVSAALLTYALVYVVAGHRFDQLVLRAFDVNQDELSRIARIESGEIRALAARVVGRAESRSLSLPLAGIGLLAPLTMHLAIWIVTNAGRVTSNAWLLGFDWWIAASLALVGIAHVVLALQGARFASEAAKMPTYQLDHRSPVSGWAALGYTVVGSLLPGVFALAIPPLVVFATGIVFVPWMFWSMRRRLASERRLLEDD